LRATGTHSLDFLCRRTRPLPGTSLTYFCLQPFYHTKNSDSLLGLHNR